MELIPVPFLVELAQFSQNLFYICHNKRDSYKEIIIFGLILHNLYICLNRMVVRIGR